MPQRRRVSRALTKDQFEVLMNGGIFAATDVLKVFGSIEEAKKAWHLHRGDLMAEAERLTRPAAWWWFEAPRWEPPQEERPPGLKWLDHAPSPLRRVPYFQETLLAEWGLLDDLERVELARWKQTSLEET